MALNPGYLLKLCISFFQREGFFVECGAFDGETRSNTLNLERELGAKYLVFSSLVPSKREKNISVLLSLYIFEGSVFTFKFLKNTIVNFTIQKLKSKHTSLKKYTNWAKLIYFSLVLREREKKTPKYFAPFWNKDFLVA